MRHSAFVALASLVLTFAGCADDTRSPSEHPDTSTTTPEGNTEGPKTYALITQVFAPEGQTSYIVLAEDVLASQALDLENAIEFPGRAIGAGPTGGGALYVGGNEGGTITRFDLAPNERRLVPGPTVSFANEGITSVGEYGDQLQFVSPTKAYYFDGRTAQMIVWNPTEMTVERAVDLSELVVDGALLTFSTNAIRHGESLAFPLGWRSDADARIMGDAAVLLVDTTTDAIRVVHDARCGYVRTATEGADGRLYLATEAYASAVHRIVPNNAPAPCLLRLDASWSAFDATFHVDLGSLVGGATAGNLLPGASPTTAWIRVLDEKTTSVGPETHPRVLASSPAWGWWAVELGDAPKATAMPLGVGNGSDFVLNAADRAVIPEFSSDRSQTVLRDMSTGTPGATTLSVPGLVFSLVRLR